MSTNISVEISQRTHKSSLGTALCKTAEGIYQKSRTMSRLIENTTKQPSRSMNATWTVFSATSQLLSGNLFGLVGLISGGREVYNLSCQEKNSDLQRALSDIGADAEMIGMLTQSQKEHHKIIGENLDVIKENIKGLYDKLDAIQVLNTQGINDLQRKKAAALSLNKRAIEQYKNAEKLFAEAQRASKHSHLIFDKCAGLFERIFAITNDQEKPLQQKIELLEKISKQALSSCKHGQEKLDCADQKFAAAFIALQEANALKDQALMEVSQAVQQAEDALQAGLEKAQYIKECTAQIRSTQQEVERAKQNNEDILLLVDSLKQEVVQAKEAARGKLGMSEVFAGIASGVATASAGPTTAIAAGMFAAYGLHYGDSIANTTKGIYNYVLGKPSLASVTLRKDELLKVEFDQISSGMWGAYVMKRPSYTVGTLYINLGADPISFRFNLNNACPVAKEDLVALFQQLMQALQNHTITPARCMAILQELKTIRMQRGELFEDMIGLIHPDQDGTRGIVRQIEMFCEKQISQ